MKNYKQIKMPFGKYKGRYLWEIADISYFRWLYNNAKNNLKGEMLEAVKWKLNIN